MSNPVVQPGSVQETAELLLSRFRNVPGGTRKRESAKYNPKSGPHQFVSYAFSDRDREYIEEYLHTLTIVSRNDFLRGFKGFRINNTAWRIATIQKKLTLKMHVLLALFSKEEVEAFCDTYQVYEVFLDPDWEGNDLSYPELSRMLLELATQLCIEKEDHDQEKNTQITFHFTDHGNKVVSSDTFLSVVDVDARSLRFVMSEGHDWVMKNLECDIKGGKCGVNKIDSRYRNLRDYPNFSKLTGEAIYDRNRIFISRCFSCSSTATGTFEGTFGLHFISQGNGLNIKAETSSSTAESDRVSIKLMHGPKNQNLMLRISRPHPNLTINGQLRLSV
jgi:hypothetical protein